MYPRRRSQTNKVTDPINTKEKDRVFSRFLHHSCYFSFYCDLLMHYDAAEATDAPLLRWLFWATYREWRANRRHRRGPLLMGFRQSRYSQMEEVYKLHTSRRRMASG